MLKNKKWKVAIIAVLYANIQDCIKVFKYAIKNTIYAKKFKNNENKFIKHLKNS